VYVPEVLQNRTYLIIIIGFVTTVTALGPFFVGQTMTTMLAVHELLHIAQITFGLFLVIVSILAYTTTRSNGLIFTVFAFITFTLLSFFLLEEDITGDRIEHHEAVYVDVLLTVMAGFFAMAVFSNHKLSGRTKYN